MSGDRVDVSVVLPTWNNSERLGVTLRALRACAVPDGLRWELVVVNNNCTDATDAVVAALAPTLPELVYLHEPRSGVSRARNAGVRRALGNLLVFTDDDVTPCRTWLGTYVAAARARPAGFYFGGPVDSEFESAVPDRELIALGPASVKGLDLGSAERGLVEGEYFIGANWACPRQAVLDAGGYDENVGLDASRGEVRGGSETDLMARLSAGGWRPWYLPAARITHFVPSHKSTLRHIAGRAESYARRMAEADPGPVEGPLGIPRRVYRRTAALWAAWALARLRGRPAYREYLELRRAIGRMRGLVRRRKRISA